jgi:transcriptional regulator with XRE-family HTH domain
MTTSPTNTNQVTGQNIQSLRIKVGLTQEALAQYLNTSREQIAYYEAGSRPVSSLHLSKLADLFCMNEYDFFEEDSNKRKLNIVFAFRADALQQTDLASIAKFKKIVRNYLNMKTADIDE